MKKIKLFFTLSLFTCIISCEDFTEFDRGFILNEEGSIQTVSDVERLLLGSYNSINYIGIITRNSRASDELRVGLGNRGQGLQEHSFTIVSSTPEPTALWNSLYNTIDNVNRTIVAINTVSVEDTEASLSSQILGEALALRALEYFDLLRNFAVSFDAATPGVPLVTEPLVFGESDINIPRNSVGEVLAQINADLDQAEDLLAISADGDFTRFNLNSVAALRARIALYTGDYAAAVSNATTVISAIPLVNNDADYLSMFRDDPSTSAGVAGASEVIFQIDRDVQDGFVGTIFTAVNNDVFFSTSSDLFSFLSSDGSIRSTVNIDTESDITTATATTDELIVGKYLGSSATPYLNNIKVFRTSEMVLIRAEANARLGNLTDAMADIVDLRAARGSSLVTPDYTSSAIALTDILLERRLELAFEGHRFFDLKRFNLPVDRPDADCNNPDRTAPTTCFLEAGNFIFTYPIPQAELFANPGINDENQNPGY